MIYDSEVNFGDLVTMTNGGVAVATFPKILAMLKKRYKEVYGSDINLEMTTADGVWLHDISLLINNILQTMQTLYSNLNVSTATGIYLDRICNLANVVRKPATSSRAEVTIVNVGRAQVTQYGISCIDREGRIWSSTETLTLNSNESATITLTCEELGEVIAKAGSIYQVVNTDSNVLLNVVQSVDAVVGTSEESDADMRARKNQANSPLGVTVLESLQGALLQTTGVRDAVVINNPYEADYTTYKGYDKTDINPHSIYVVLRTIDDITNDLKQNIADTIYNKITAGVMTQVPGWDDGGTWTDPDGGTGVTVPYYPSIFGQTNVGYSTNINWKQARPVYPEIIVTLTPKDHYTSSERQQVAENLMKDLNNLPLNTNLEIEDLKLRILELDPTFKSLPTYSISSVTVGGSASDYTNKLTYYGYNKIILGNTEDWAGGTDYQFKITKV